MEKEMIVHISNYAVRHSYCEAVVPIGEYEDRIVSFCYRTDMAGYLDAYDFLLTDKETMRTRPMSDKQLDEYIERFKKADNLVSEYVVAKELQRYQLINTDGMIYRTFPLRYREVDGVQCEKLVKYIDGQLVGFANADPDPFVEAYETTPALRFVVEAIDAQIKGTKTKTGKKMGTGTKTGTKTGML